MHNFYYKTTVSAEKNALEKANYLLIVFLYAIIPIQNSRFDMTMSFDVLLCPGSNI